MGQYRPMFNITLEHNYFNSGRLPGVQFKPTPDSEKLMNNANLVSRKRPDGLTIFFDRDYLDTLRLYANDADDPLKLDFECDVAQQNFMNFTSAEVFSSNKFLYFDSNNTDQAVLGKKYLHASDTVSAADLLDFDTAAKRNASPRDRRQPSMGLISIQVTPGELDELEKNPPEVFNDYYIRFDTRETYWKYYLVGDANRESAFIKDARGEVEFDFIGEETLANGRTARVFLSNKAIPLRDRAKPKFQLQVMKNNRAKVLVSRLEVASAKRINKTVVDNRELFVSEIYINF